MKFSTAIILFSKQEVLSQNFDHLFSVYPANPLATPSEHVRPLLNTLVFAVCDYDDDHRELHDIPEVRAFYQALCQKWPHWLFFARMDPVNLTSVLFSRIAGFSSILDTQRNLLTLRHYTGALRAILARDLEQMFILANHAKVPRRIQEERVAILEQSFFSKLP